MVHMYKDIFTQAHEYAQNKSYFNDPANPNMAVMTKNKNVIDFENLKSNAKVSDGSGCRLQLKSVLLIYKKK